MTKGQRAAVAFKISLIIKEKGFKVAAERIEVTAGYMSQAKLVHEYAPPLLDAVIAGSSDPFFSRRPNSGIFRENDYGH